MKASVVGIALLLWAGSWSSVAGQDQGVRWEGRGGFGIPTGALAEMLDPGPALGLSAAFPVSRRVAVKVEGVGELFRRVEAVQAWHYLIGLEVSLIESNLLGPPGSPWSLIVEGTVGGTSFTRLGNDNVGFIGTPRTSLLQTSPSLGAGLKLSRLVAYTVAFFVEARGILMLTHPDDAPGWNSTIPGFGPQLSIPLMVGLRVRP